jgi:hypothetical protein
MYGRGIDNTIMVVLFIICLLSISIQMIGASKEIIVENPFYLRARIYDSQTASVQFEIAEENNQRTCEMYKFTIRRNREYPYSMPEQKLTFWSNSLELKHLPVGDYRICAIICSEYLKQPPTYDEMFSKKNRSIPISACVNIHAYRSHFLILTLYFLVILILAFSQIIFSLRKRKIQARIKTALIEVENTLQKWRASQTSGDHAQSYTILQSLLTLPASPIEYSTTLPFHPPIEEHRPSHPIIFHLGALNENDEQLISMKTSDIP